jgi:diacylglycerol kinase (ATP)
MVSSFAATKVRMWGALRRKMRVLAAGGDGTVAWILKTVRELGLHPAPHVAVMPLGTGNDLSLSFGWGNAFLQSWINVRPFAGPPTFARSGSLLGAP